MAKVTCPFCEKEVEIAGENFPDLACDTEIVDCPKCEQPIEISWYAVFEAYKPETRPTLHAPDAAIA
jgi:endogenous inhibitor of DNA gyrase (YacG/DUF329 family)